MHMHSTAVHFPSDKQKIKNNGETYKQIFANSWKYNTSSRFQIDIDGLEYTLRTPIDKSSLKEGDTFKNIEFGNFLSMLIKEGHNYFYKGDGLNIILKFLDNKSNLSKNDFSDYQTFERKVLIIFSFDSYISVFIFYYFSSIIRFLFVYADTIRT